MSPETWTPPENPDLHAILDEAQEDAEKNRYELALAKHVWFFEHALDFDPDMSGVRLSFALGDWLKLAQDYPPALEKLKELRDAATLRVLSGTEDEQLFDSFHDMVSLNECLGEDHINCEIFISLHETSPEAARQVFHSAKPSLVRARAYDLIGQYISPRLDLAYMRYSYVCLLEVDNDEHSIDFANQKYVNESTTLVAILFHLGREQEAKQIAAQARLEWDDVSFHKALDNALNGVVPEPWP